MIRRALVIGTSLLALAACAGAQKPAPVVAYGAGWGEGSTGVHTVLEGDTVYTISERYQLPMRDIIVMNSLSAPYKMNVGFRVKLPPPNEYKVKPGDTLQSVARLNDVSVNEIASLNDLKSPYKIVRGQVLRLPTPQEKAPADTMTFARFEPETAPSARVDAVEKVELGAPSQGESSMPPQPQARVQQASVPSAAIPDMTPPRSGDGRFMWPVEGKVISTYGPKADGLHNDGINIQAPRGTPVRAAENGTVVYTGSDLQGYGNLVLVRHQGGYMSAYAHMDKVLIKRGETVKRGQSIGTVGTSGQADTPQLHFEIRKGTEALNPQRHL